ncbi:hypothetical protein ACWDA7_45915 [Streptomyces sp. NPDC001156]
MVAASPALSYALHGRTRHRCTADDPTAPRTPIRAPHPQPWKWVPCPHGYGYVGQPEIRPSILYGLIPQISPSATPANVENAR